MSLIKNIKFLSFKDKLALLSSQSFLKAQEQFKFNKKIFILFYLVFFFLPNRTLAFTEELLAPFNTAAKYPMFIGAFLTTALASRESNLKLTTQNEVQENKPLGKYSKYGDLLGEVWPNLAYFTLEGLAGVLFGLDYSLTSAGIMFSATIYSVLVNTSLKYLIREPRPNGYDDLSFPSGHSATAFAFASVVGMREPWYIGILAYAMAAFVAFSRMNDNWHYLHDVVGGATIGISYGIGISLLRSTNYSNLAENFRPVFLPGGMQLSYVFSF